jgi:hypothetical protein
VSKTSSGAAFNHGVVRLPELWTVTQWHVEQLQWHGAQWRTFSRNDVLGAVVQFVPDLSTVVLLRCGFQCASWPLAGGKDNRKTKTS